MNVGDYFFDEHLTRYQLAKYNTGKLNYNWLFLPGGPGIDSCYLQLLISKLDIGCGSFSVGGETSSDFRGFLFLHKSYDDIDLQA